MPKKRFEATSFVYNNQVVIAGGFCAESGYLDDMIGIIVDLFPDLSIHWSEFPVKLPAKLGYHSSVLCNERLMVTGGYEGGGGGGGG